MFASLQGHIAVVLRKPSVRKLQLKDYCICSEENSTAPCYLSNSWDKLKKKKTQGGQWEERKLLFVCVSGVLTFLSFSAVVWWLFKFCFETLMSELTLSLWYLWDLLPGRGQTHDPVPLDVALHLGLLAKGTGDSGRKVRNVIHLQQKLKVRWRRCHGSNVRLVWCIGTIDC